MTDDLSAMIDAIRTYQMSDAERQAQRLSFAFGNANATKGRVSREDVERAAKEMVEGSAS